MELSKNDLIKTHILTTFQRFFSFIFYVITKVKKKPVPSIRVFALQKGRGTNYIPTDVFIVFHLDYRDLYVNHVCDERNRCTCVICICQRWRRMTCTPTYI